MRLVVPLFLLCSTASCAAELQAVSSGLIGCAPDEITIDHEASTFGGVKSWQAHCNGQTYQCSAAHKHSACSPLQPAQATHAEVARIRDDDAPSDSTSASQPLSGGSGGGGGGGGGGDGTACRDAFQHIQELAAAWAEWHPDGKPKSPPGRMEFLSVCHDLSKQQQECLVMPAAKERRDQCAPYFDALAPKYRARLDGLFLTPP